MTATDTQKIVRLLETIAEGLRRPDSPPPRLTTQERIRLVLAGGPKDYRDVIAAVGRSRACVFANANKMPDLIRNRGLWRLATHGVAESPHDE